MGIWRLARLDARPVKALRDRPLPDGVRRPAQPDARPEGGTHDLTIFDTTHFIDAKLGPTTPSHDNFCRLATSQRRKMMSSVSARHFSSSR